MIRQYSPKDINIMHAGIPLLGMGDADFVTVARSGDLWEYQKGATGDTVRIELTDDSALATVTLLAGSPSNDRLSARAVLDRRTKRGYGEFLLDDIFGTTLVHGPVSWIVNMPEITYGKGGPQREWKFLIADCVVFAGGTVL